MNKGTIRGSVQRPSFPQIKDRFALIPMAATTLTLITSTRPFEFGISFPVNVIRQLLNIQSTFFSVNIL